MLCHQTEDDKKVKTALFNVVGPAMEKAEDFEKKLTWENFTGHNKNKIISFSMELGKRGAGLFAGHLKAKLNGSDREKLAREAELRLHENQFCFKLDKQGAYGGNLILSDGDDCISIAMTMVSFPKNAEATCREIKELFG